MGGRDVAQIRSRELASQKSMIRLPTQTERGIPFRDLLRIRAPLQAPMVEAYLLQFEVLADELGERPSDSEYRRRWPRGTRWGPEDEELAFSTVFPGVDPLSVLDVLHAGARIRGGVLPELMEVSVLWT